MDEDKKKRAQKVFDKLFQEATNKTCVDCPVHNPQWASVSHGTYLCIKCAGVHRGLGVHLSFVRSCTMDTWSPVQLGRMKAGGNARMKEFWEQQSFPKGLSPSETYDNDAMEKYRAQILAEGKGGPRQDIPVIGYQKKIRAPKKGFGGSGGGMGSNGAGSSQRGFGSGGKSQQTGRSMPGFGSGGPSKHDTEDAWGSWDTFANSMQKGATKFGSAIATGATKAAQGASTYAVQASAAAADGMRKMQDEEALKDVGTKLKSGWSSMTGWFSKTVSKLGDSTGTGDLAFYNKEAVGDVKPSSMQAMGSQEYFEQNRKKMPALSSEGFFSEQATSSQEVPVVVSKEPARAKPQPKKKSKPKPKKNSNDWGFDGFDDDDPKAEAGTDDGFGDLSLGDDLDDLDLGTEEEEEKPAPKAKTKPRKKSDPGDDPDDWGWGS